MTSDVKAVSDDQLWRIVCDALGKFNHAAVPLTADTNITSDLNIDSVSILELLFELEEVLDISIPIDTLVDVSTIGELINRIQQIIEKY